MDRPHGEPLSPDRVDVLVVGGGPAGCAAAIAAARAGARVMLLERESEPVPRPGESLHPGIEPLLESLGALEALRSATLGRYRGHWIVNARGRRFQPFGSDATGEWFGFQADRCLLDMGLREAARSAGATVHCGGAVTELLRSNPGGGRVAGVQAKDGQMHRARVVIDATGGRHWIARKLGLGVGRLSPRYIATFGYGRLEPGSGGDLNHLPAEPEFREDMAGWTWIAPLDPGCWHWTRLSYAASRMPPDWVPEQLARLTPCGRSRGADVTWRMLPAAAGLGWLAVGDAAAVLDPSASHGVLRALYAGALAGQTAAEACGDPGRERDQLAAYDQWYRDGVLQDVQALRQTSRPTASGRNRSGVPARYGRGRPSRTR